MPRHESHTHGPGVDEHQADQNDPARLSVREQLAQALAKTAADYHRLWCPERFSLDDCKYPTCSDNRLALDRHRAELEERVCTDACPYYYRDDARDQPTRGGTEAQREPAGGGRA